MTPYQYGANNPELFIDVNGDSIMIRNGKENIMYRDGSLFWAGTNKSYDGKAMRTKGEKAGQLKGFVGKTLNALNDIKNGGDIGNELVSNLENSKTYTTIRDGGNSALGTSVSWDPNESSSGLDAAGNTSRPSYIGLAHELAHSWDLISDGSLDQGEWFQMGGKSIPLAEQYSMHVENQIRAENGIALRVYYGKTIDYSNGKISGEGRVLRPGNTSSLFYNAPIKDPLKSLRGPFIYGLHKGL
jgi:hypothetical protein